MKMEEKECSKLIDSILDVLEPAVDGEGRFEFIAWNNEPAGFQLILSGDWKHMHARANYIVKEEAAKYNLHVKIDEDEIGDSECDWYEAYHTYYFRKSEPKKTKAELAEIEELNKLANIIPEVKEL